MTDFASLIARWRVRLGYVTAIVTLLLARPSPASVALGGVIGLLGLFLRAYAAGYLHKQQILTVSGPYAHTRNPLYLGSSLLAVGAAVAMKSWPSAIILLVYFALVYSVVMRREEKELRAHHSTAFDDYACAVPLFFPRITPARIAPEVGCSFSFFLYRKNREYQAAIGYLVLLILLLAIWRLRMP